MLFKWLANPALPMESTVHLAIVATTLIVLGMDGAFSAFFLNLLVREGKGVTATQATQAMPCARR